MLTFAHISDPHFGADPVGVDELAVGRHGVGRHGVDQLGVDRARERAERVMAWLRPMPLDLILVTGDIADHGEPAEYAEAREVLKADVPVLILPGNHDHRDAFRRGLGPAGEPADFPVNAVHTVGGVVFALCDSSIPGRNEGVLTPSTLGWLRAVLSTEDRPTFVAMHHPPTRMHHELFDTMLLTNPDELAELLADFPQVVAVLCGHAHSAAATTFAGRPLLVAPGLVSAMRLDWSVDGPMTADAIIDWDQPPGVAFHVLDDDGRVTTHYRAVNPSLL